MLTTTPVTMDQIIRNYQQLFRILMARRQSLKHAQAAVNALQSQIEAVKEQIDQTENHILDLCKGDG